MPRKTVNLTEDEAERLASFFQGETPERSALARAVGEDTAPYSESSVLRQLTLLGMRYVQDEVLREGYEALAVAETDEDRRAVEAMEDVSMEAMGDD